MPGFLIPPLSAAAPIFRHFTCARDPFHPVHKVGVDFSNISYQGL
jgi:hypothetical protein